MTKRNWLLLGLCAMLLCSCVLLASCKVDSGSGDGTENGTGDGGNNGNVAQDEYYIVDVQMVTPPTKSDYGEGDIFDPAGMVLKVIWNDGWEQLVNDGKNCIFSPAGPITADTEVITATYDDKVFTLPVNVNKITGIRISSMPARTLYAEGEDFSDIGLQVVTVLENGSDGNVVTDYTLSGNLKALTPDDKKVTVSYERAGKTYTADIPIRVLSKDALIVIEAESGTVVGGEKVTKSLLLDYASGRSFVRNLKEGATIAINIPATKATTAFIRFVASSYEDDPEGGAFAIPLQINEVVKVSFNGVEIAISDNEIVPGGYDDERGNLSRYCHWYEIALDEVTLNEGDNIFVITSLVNMNLQDDENTPDVNEADLHSTLFDCLRVFYTDIDAMPEGDDFTHTHTEVDVPGKPATCSETGLTDGKKCSVCGAVTVAQTVIGTLPHTPGEAFEENRIEPDCTTDGSYDLVTKCTVCEAEVTRTTKTIAATGHSYTDSNDESCNNEGCDFVRDLNCEHTYEATITKKPTPTEEGIKTYVCSKCSDSYTESIAKLVEAIYEMENGVVVGGSIVPDGKSGLTKFMSGKGFVRNLGLGATITIKVVMDDATKGNIILVMSSHEDNGGKLASTLPVNVKEAITVTINGVNYAIGDDAILPGGPDYDFDGDGKADSLTKHCHWYELVFEDVELNAGENTIVITSIADSSETTDYMADLHSAIYDCVKVQYAPVPHTHTPSDAWEYDETNHWNDRTANDGQEYNKAEHIFDNACDVDCACGYVRVITHDYSDAWTYDENQHWHVCKTENCGATDTKENHVFDNACDTDCACGYVRTITHDYSDAWTYDESQHWHVCKTENCGATDTKENHVFDNACDTDCACGYVRSVPHDFTGEWQKDASGHWHICLTEGCDVTDTKADHTFGEWQETKPATEAENGSKERSCSACSYVETAVIPAIGHTHTESSEWEYNDTYHWNDCVANDGQEYNKAEHIFDNACDTDCTCGYVREITHDFSGEWVSDADGHWHVCATEGCDVTDTKADHIWNAGEITQNPTEDTEGVKTYTCTECGATKTEALAKIVERIIEAENTVLSNAELASSGTVIKYTSGGKFVRNLKEGGTITFRVLATKSTTVTLRLVMASHEDALDAEGNKLTSTMDLIPSEYLTLTLNGQEITIPADFTLYGGSDYDVDGDGTVDTVSRYAHFYELVLPDVELNEGVNTFVITSTVDMSNDNPDDLHSTLFDSLKVWYNDESEIPAPLTETKIEAENAILSGFTTAGTHGTASTGQAAHFSNETFIKDAKSGATVTLTIDSTTACKINLTMRGVSTSNANLAVGKLLKSVKINGTTVATYTSENTETCFTANGGAFTPDKHSTYIFGEFDLAVGTNTIVITFNASSAAFIDYFTVTPVEE